MRLTRHPGRKLAAIYPGGVAGALIRVGLAQAFPPGAGTWPWPTFAVNLVGALLLGYFFALFRDRPAGEPPPPLPRHRHLRHPDHLLDPAARALRPRRRRRARARAAYCAATLAAGYLLPAAGDRARGAPAAAPAAAEARDERRRLDRGRPPRRRRRGGPLRPRLRDRAARRGAVPARDPRRQPARGAGDRRRRRLDPGRRGGDDRQRRRDRLLHHLLDLDPRLAPARGRPRRADLAWLNIGLSIVAGFAAVALGHWLGAAL